MKTRIFDARTSGFILQFPGEFFCMELFHRSVYFSIITQVYEIYMYKRLLDHCHPRLKLAIKAFSRKNKIWSSWQEGERPTCAIARCQPCLPYQPLPASAPEKQWTKINREHHLESNTTMLSPHVWSHAWIGRLPSTAANFPSSHHLVTMQALCKSKVTWTIQIKNSKIIST